MITILLILLALAIAYATWSLFPDEVRRWFRRMKAARKTIFGIVAIIVALAFIGSGYLPLMLVGFAMFVYIGWYYFIENPDEMIRSRI